MRIPVFFVCLFLCSYFEPLQLLNRVHKCWVWKLVSGSRKRTQQFWGRKSEIKVQKSKFSFSEPEDPAPHNTSIEAQKSLHFNSFFFFFLKYIKLLQLYFPPLSMQLAPNSLVAIVMQSISDNEQRNNDTTALLNLMKREPCNFIHLLTALLSLLPSTPLILRSEQIPLTFASF